VIVINPNLLQQEFISYMTDLFNLSAGQFQAWLVGGIILIFVVTAIINVFDGFRKARHH
jgi:hypothetical protein